VIAFVLLEKMTIRRVRVPMGATMVP